MSKYHKTYKTLKTVFMLRGERQPAAIQRQHSCGAVIRLFCKF